MVAGDANVMRGERNAESFALLVSLKMSGREVAVWEDEKCSILQINAQRAVVRHLDANGKQYHALEKSVDCGWKLTG